MSMLLSVPIAVAGQAVPGSCDAGGRRLIALRESHRWAGWPACVEAPS